jgi:uncharacterized lipoprotein
VTAARAQWQLVLVVALAAAAILPLTACSSPDSSDSAAASSDSGQAAPGFAATAPPGVVDHGRLQPPRMTATVRVKDGPDRERRAG